MTHRRFIVYGFLFLLNTISYVDRVNMSVAGHSISLAFGLSPIALGYLFSSFLWAYVLMMLPGGRLIDAWGAHRVASVCAAIWSVAQVCTGLAGGFATMVIARLGLGVGEAPVSPISYRSVRDWAPYTEHGRAIGLIQSGQLLGPALGAPLVAWLIATTSWRWSFAITGAAGLVWVVAWSSLVSTAERTRWLPDAERRRILRERHADRTPGDEAAEQPGIGYRGLLLSPSMWGLALSQGCAVYSVYLYLSWLPNYLQTARGLSLVSSGLFTAVPFFAGAVVIVVVNWIGDKILSADQVRGGRRRIVVAACLFLTAAGAAIPYVQSLTMVVILTMLPVGFANTAAATNAALTSDLLRSPADAGRAFAFLVLGGNVFGLLAPIVTGYTVQASGGFASAFMVAGVVAVAGALISLTLTRHTLGASTLGGPTVGGPTTTAPVRAPSRG